MLGRLLTFVLIVSTAACLPKTTSSRVQDVGVVDMAQSIGSKSEFMKLVGQVSGTEPMVKLTLFKNTGAIYYQNTAKYNFHINFLKDKFPEYKTLTMPAFEQLIFSEPPTLLAGAVYWLDEFVAGDLPSPGALGFNMYFSPQNGASGFNPEYVELMRKRISETIAYPIDKIVYIFDSVPAFFKGKMLLAQKGIKSYPINAIIGTSNKPRVYSSAKSYGYLRSISAAEFEAGEYSSRDILVFDEVPIDIGPVAGVISSTPQVPNSHVIFRAVNMKIPNLFLPNARSVPSISRNIGKLVEFSSSKEGEWSVKGADEVANIIELAEAYFAQRVPALPPPRANLQETNLFDMTTNEPTPALAERYGAKGSNFALLDWALRKGGVDRSFTNGSFLIPYSFNAAHMSQKLTLALCQKAAEKCSKNYSTECQSASRACTDVAAKGGSLRDFAGVISSPSYTAQMLASGKMRKASLETLQYVIKKTEMLPKHLSQIKSSLAQRWPATTRVRFRSSSNAEDFSGLTGAGLYSSHSGCMADEGVVNSGPSACMTPLELNRTKALIAKLRGLNDPKLASLIAEFEEKLTDKDFVADAIRKVFASLWNERAFLSRDYYRIPHDKIYMAVLTHPSFADDSANGVAVVEKENNEIRADVVVQIDDISTTNPVIPGAVAEEVILSSKSGPAAARYISRSNQVLGGGTVLSQAQLGDLLRQFEIVYNAFTMAGLNTTGRVDIEIKRNAQGQMQIKQMRSL